MQEANKALAVNSKSILGNFFAARVYRQQGKFLESLNCFQTILAQEPKFYSMKIATATSYVALGRTNNAINELEDAIFISMIMSICDCGREPC